jgi:hypothetical protein
MSYIYIITNTCTKDNTGTGAGVIESQSDRFWGIINKQSHTIEDKQQTDIIRIGPNRFNHKPRHATGMTYTPTYTHRRGVNYDFRPHSVIKKKINKKNIKKKF